MAVCSYFLRGQCRFGDRCKNEHPKDREPTFGNNSWSYGGSKNNAIQFAYTIDSMSKDLELKNDKPGWSLSSYGPAKHELNLVSGLDESFEELHLKAALALSNNSVQDYIKYESERILTADQIYNNARNNLEQAYEQAMKNSKGPEAPSSGSVFGAGGGSAFGANNNATFSSGNTGSTFGGEGGGALGSKPGTSAFGQPSTFGQPTASAFGQPQPTITTASAFGQPVQGGSVFGGQPQATAAFGQSSLIKPATAFGTPSSSTGSAFGSGSGGGGFSAFAGQQPSAFGLAAAANNTGGSVFRQTSAPGSATTPSGSTSAFGAGTTSAFGAPTQGGTTATSAFGAPAAASAFGAPSNTSVFGAPTQGSAQSAFGASPTTPGFGNGSTGASTFGAPSAFGALAQQPTISAFGAQSSTPSATSAFGAPAQGISAFGNANNNFPASAFGAASSSNSPFGGQTQPSALGSTTSAFGLQPSKSVFGSSGFPNTTNSAPPTTSNLNKPKSGPPDFQNAPSKYKAGQHKCDELLPENYIDLLPAPAREAFEGKKFEWGKIPEWIPPLSLR